MYIFAPVKLKIVVLFYFILIINVLKAQQPLPAFAANFLGGNKAQITWINPFPNCTQVSIQKSYDSTKFFQTIFTAQSPELPANGYIDNNYLPQIKTWYRIFYVTDSLGSFFFTKSQIPSLPKPKSSLNSNITQQEIIKIPVALLPPKNVEDTSIAIPIVKPIEININVFYKNSDSLLNTFIPADFLRFKDSIALKTKDTLQSSKLYSYFLKPYVPLIVWKPSVYVFSTKKGAIEINIPKSKSHNYKLIVYDHSGKEQFRIKNILVQKVLLEKSNFPKAGWYTFELFEDDKLKEKNKFLVEKDY